MRIFSKQVIQINEGSGEMGPVCQMLYDRVRAVQAGEAEDKFGWMEAVWDTLCNREKIQTWA